MNNTNKSVRIMDQREQPNLSASQKLFNQLIQKIEAKRKLLGEWQTTELLYQQKYMEKLDPLMQTFEELQIELVHVLDNAYFEKGFSKHEKAKIQDIICSIARQLIAKNDNEALKKIYDTHSHTDFDTQIQEEQEAIKLMMEGILGMELNDDDIDFSSPESVMAHVSEKMQQKQNDEEQGQQAHKEQQDKRKKSAKTLEKEAKQQEETQNISQSIREVYRKLASALHPDREQDDLERLRKIGLMQRVNIAYSNKDLLQLLELQLEIEQIDQAAIGSLSEERLKYYNKILATQSQELQNEVLATEFSFKRRFNITTETSLSPKTAMRELQAAITSMDYGIRSLKKDLAWFQNIKNIKNWLQSH